MTGGAMVNTGSVNSYYAEGGIAAYCASKGALIQLTGAMAINHSDEGIRVNCLCPGWTETPLNAPFFDPAPDARPLAGRLVSRAERFRTTWAEQNCTTPAVWILVVVANNK